MDSELDKTKTRPCWFLNSVFEGGKDQIARFVQEGIWENKTQDKYINEIKSIQAGDRIAIKTVYTQKNGLPFDNRGRDISTMEIKAIGTVKENIGNGHNLKVDWTAVNPPRKWYFYTHLRILWKVLPKNWRKKALIEFTFEGKEQDIDRFRNDPFWRDRFGDIIDDTNNEENHTPEIEHLPPSSTLYSIDDILNEGCFISREKLSTILERLETKKNLILQGPPGTGKSWLAKRLAFALIGQRDDKKIRAVQFHPNLSYEDFIRGWRPSGEGRLSLVDGPFLQMIKTAKENLDAKHVIVIEEINRGHPAQIFGEMLTLLEADKRRVDEALELSYQRTDDERIYIPENLYLIGTMNIADRSLALVDLALRRRFAFIDLKPTLGKPWEEWLHSQFSIDLTTLKEIETRLNSLNIEISDDTTLGAQFQVGHSYVTPPLNTPIADAREWFRQVVETEIAPLLDEYWFDDLSKSKKAKDRLLDGF